MGFRKWIIDEFRAVCEAVGSTSHRWHLNARDRAKIYWAMLLGCSGPAIAGIAEMAEFTRSYVVPSLQQGGLRTILIGMALTGLSQFVIVLIHGPKKPPEEPPQ